MSSPDLLWPPTDPLTVHAGDMLLVRFMHLDSRDPDRECTLFVDLSQDDYKGEKLSGER